MVDMEQTNAKREEHPQPSFTETDLVSMYISRRDVMIDTSNIFHVEFD